MAGRSRCHEVERLIFVDSSVWVNYFNGVQNVETNRIDSLLGVEPVALGDLNLAEILQGFRHDRDYKTAKEILTACIIFELGGADMAVKAADNFRFLRKKGISVRKTIDVFIATFCIENNLPLLHADRDFDPFHIHLGLQNGLEKI